MCFLFFQPAIVFADPFTAAQTTPDKKQKKALKGGGVERHPERRTERDGQDEAAWMPLRGRNEPGMANPRGP